MPELTDDRLETIFRRHFSRSTFGGAWRRFGYAVAAEVEAPSPELAEAAVRARTALRGLVSSLLAARHAVRDAETRAAATAACELGEAAIDALTEALSPAVPRRAQAPKTEERVP